MASNVYDRHVSILHLEDSSTDHELAVIALNRSGLDYAIQRVESLADFAAQLHARAFHIVVADYRLSGFTAIDAWNELLASQQNIPFVLLSGAIGEVAAVQALHLGIADYLPKDAMARLAHVLVRALELREAKIQKDIASHELAVSQQRLAQLTEHLQTSIEAERTSIAREIHDDIGGSLAAIRFDLAWLDRHTSDRHAKRHIESAAQMLQHAIGASQRIMMDLRPPVLEEGLLAALQWLASSFEKRTDIPVAYTPPRASVALPAAMELVAYRCAQEALTNISKYAQASKVQIDLSYAKDVLTLEITDDGCGFDRHRLHEATGFGLKGLTERAKTVDGWLDISSSSGKGTALVLSIPIAHGLLHDTQPD